MKDIEVIPELWEVIRDRLAHPREGSYVSRLATGEKGIDGILEKVGEEAVEFIRVPYDVQTTVNKIKAIDALDNFLGIRLIDGR